MLSKVTIIIQGVVFYLKFKDSKFKIQNSKFKDLKFKDLNPIFLQK